MDRKRLEFAADGFLTAMRLAQARRAPAAPTTIRRLADYPEADRNVLLTAIGKAILLTNPKSDQAFKAWLADQISATAESDSTFAGDLNK